LLGEPLTLAPKNQTIVENLCKFILKNPKLIYFDLSYTGLCEQALDLITDAIKESQSVKAVNFSGNPGISNKLIESLKVKLESKP